MLKNLLKLQGYLIETLMVNQKRWLYDVANEKRKFSRGLGWTMDFYGKWMIVRNL